MVSVGFGVGVDRICDRKIDLFHENSRNPRKKTAKVVKNFMCDSCGKAYGTKGQLKAHTQTHIAVDVLAFECDICHRR